MNPPIWIADTDVRQGTKLSKLRDCLHKHVFDLYEAGVYSGKDFVYLTSRCEYLAAAEFEMEMPVLKTEMPDESVLSLLVNEDDPKAIIESMYEWVPYENTV